jgi:hypothetical protein
MRGSAFNPARPQNHYVVNLVQHGAAGACEFERISQANMVLARPSKAATEE